MNNNVLSLLQTLGGLPNWKYQLGESQVGAQEQGNTQQYQLGQQSLADQMAQFQAQQAMALAQQQWAQQFANQGQQFGQQQTAAQNAIANQTGQIQNQYLPMEIMRQLSMQARGGGAPAKTGAGSPTPFGLPSTTFGWTPAGSNQVMAGWPPS
jgi:hypothetical protein